MKRLALWFAVLPVMAACGSDAGGGNGGGDGGFKDAATKPYVDDAGNIIYPQVDASLIGPTCGMQTAVIGTTKVVTPPDVLIVLDKSGSMNMSFPGAMAGATRWTAMVAALETMTSAQQMNVKFGLEMFPSDNTCGIGAAPVVGVALNTAGQIMSALATQPGGRTPTPGALDAARAYFAARTPVNPAGRYVLLATDGEPNCGPGNNTTSTIPQSLTAVTNLASDGVKTFVIGVAGDLNSTDVQFLNDAATAGGTARTGTTKYYPVASQSDLQTALDTIAGSVQMPSCVFSLNSAPPVPDNVAVTLGGAQVPRSTMHTDGWDYAPDALHITFFGTACTQILGGAASNVSFVYGCPGPKIN